MMVGNNLKDSQLQQIVDKTIIEADQSGLGKVSFEGFKKIVDKSDITRQMVIDSNKI
jgi:serine/threonine-protein phosphatase 2B regulatory subunit